MKKALILFVAVLAGVTGCATRQGRGLEGVDLQQKQVSYSFHLPELSPEIQAQILALDPTHITDRELQEVLASAPAPRIISIHGGILPIHTTMVSFAEFLVGMGYPRPSLVNPADGTYAFSCYESSETLAGMIAWYYEKEGLRPMIVGHSQGGMLAVKVLYKLDGRTAERLQVWSPLTGEPEPREELIDPLTGDTRPVVGLQLPYVTVVGAGGLARFLPHQWPLLGRLRKIPDSTEEFAGFYKGFDLLGGDFLGYGSANESEPINGAAVRCVRLPWWYNHNTIPDTRHLLASPQIKTWVQGYHPTDPPMAQAPAFEAESTNILWAAEVWYSIKKHWVLELQRFIRARLMLAQSQS